MAIPNYLAKIKSSGAYRYVFDKSVVPQSQRNSIRLVVGYSERGPFNTPVYISEPSEFISTFGNISRRMERKGVFFHRLALQALEAGPILALNIKPFKNETAKMISFNASDIVCGEEITVNIAPDSINLTPVAVFDSNKTDMLAKATAAGLAARDFVSPVPDYDKTYTFVSSRSEDAALIRTIETLKIDGVSTRLEVYWKSTKSDATHGATSNPFVSAHFDYDKTYFNSEFYDNTDNQITIKGSQKDHKDDILDDALIALDGTNVAGERLTTIYNTNRFWKVTDNIMDISPLAQGRGSNSDYMRIVQTSSKEDSVTIFIRPYIPEGYNIKISDWYSSEVTTEMPPYMEALRDHMLSEFFVEIYVFRGDLRSSDLFSSEGTLGAEVRSANDSGVYETKFYPFCTCTDSEGKDSKGDDTTLRTNSDFRNAFGAPADALAAMADVATSNFIGKYQGIMFPSFADANGNFISIDSLFNEDYSSHKCLMALDEGLLDEAYENDLDGNEVYGTTEDNNVTAGGVVVTGKGISHLVHLLTSSVHSYKSGDGANYSNDYSSVAVPPVNASVVGYYLEGYNYTTILRNESGRSLIEDKIYAVLGYKGIYEALTNNVDVDYKYWVDTFQAYPGVSMKSPISAVLKAKFNCLGILNFAPMHDCATYLGFPGLTGGFDMQKVTKRGSGISLPAEVQGASWCAFYTQLQMTDGTNNFIIPSAALVSNLFMEKWSTRLPYYIVAGFNYGRIAYPGVVGPDYNYARADLDALEPFGVNAIVFIPRKGVIINSNQTAKQSPVSALSKVHIRELVTYLQDTIEDMLYNYQWELNSSQLRDTIKSKADTILGLIQSNNGIYAFKTVCDETNNTDETIAAEMFILDIEIEPTPGTGKVVQTLTIQKKGGITSAS